MQDHLARAMAAEGKIRAVACITTNLVNEISFLQGASPAVSIALGRALSGTALMASTLKQGQRLAVKFEGSGPMQKLVCEADWGGILRATVGKPEAMAATIPDLLGRAGFLTVSKDLGLKEPYKGTVQLYTSEIGEDIAYYLTDSEQIPSAIGLSAALTEDGSVAVAGGFMIQSLPPADQAAVEQIMEKIENLPSLAQLLQNGKTPEQLLELLLDGLDYITLESTDLRFRCGCSKEKVKQALAVLGKEETKRLIEEQGEVIITCEFCKQEYRLTKDEIRQYLP